MQHPNIILQLLKSIILLGIVVCCCFMLPPLGSLGAVLAATLFVSLLVGAVNAYWYIIGRTEKSLTFASQGWITWFLGRRGMAYCIILMLAFLCSLCFVIHVPSLDSIGFGFIFLTVPGFAVVYYCFWKIFERESRDWLIAGRTIKWSLLTTPLFMVLLYGLFLHYSGFLPVYETLGDAIDVQPKPWENAGSALLRQAGEYAILWGACRDFGVGQLFQINDHLAVLLIALGYGTLFFNVCSLLAFCFVPLSEYKRLVLQLTPSLELPKIAPKQYVPIGATVLLALMPLVSALFLWQEPIAKMIPNPEPVKVALIQIGDRFIKKDVPLLIDELRDKLQDELHRNLEGPLGTLDVFEKTLEQFKQEREELQTRLTGLKSNTFVELKKLHEEELFPQIERNVDAYLDWYYSIPGEYARLGHLTAGNFEPYMKDKLNEYLNRNVDVQRAEGMMRRFSDESGKIASQIAAIEKLTNQLLEQVAEVSEEVARINDEFQAKWMQGVDAVISANEVPPPKDMSRAEIVEYASMDDFLESFQGISVELSAIAERFEIYMTEMRDLLKIFAHHSDEYLSFRNRMTAAHTTGLAGFGVGASMGARIAYRIASKPVFKEAAAVVVKTVLKRTTGIGGGVAGGAAVGAGVGSAVPVIGTGVGAVAGGIIGGVGAWIATDYALIKLEEYLSREKFKREILYSVNDQKAEVMKALDDIFQVTD